jgi:hypothetical protein
MPPMQFIRITGRGRTPQRGCKRWETIEGVTAEAARVPGNVPHIRYPDEPRIVYGCNPTEVGQQAIDLSYRARNRIGHRLKSDGVVLIAGVVTYPLPVADMGSFECDWDVYHLWVAETLRFLLEEHGDSLKSVVEHGEEAHLHLHFYTLPRLAADNRLDFSKAHPGRQALSDAVDRGVQPAAQQAAYTQAMIVFQDRYHAQVSRFFGHARVGPRRERFDRTRYKVVRQSEKDLSRMRAELELEYRMPVTGEEAESRAKRVSEVDFIAAAVEEQNKLLAENARLRARLREKGIEPDEVTVPPQPVKPQPVSDDYVPHALAVLDKLDELDKMPEPEPRHTATPDNNLRTAYATKMDILIEYPASKSSDDEGYEPQDEVPSLGPP